MWTNNGKKILAYQTFTMTNSSTMNLTSMYGIVGNCSIAGGTKNLSGASVATSSSYNSYNEPQKTLSSSTPSYVVIFVGTGTTEPTAEDTTLENLVPMTVPTTGTPATIQTSGTTTTISFNLINSSGSEQTITEIGLATAIVGFLRDGSTSQQGEWVLMNRKLLPEPVTMGVNEVYTFAYQLDWANLTD